MKFPYHIAVAVWCCAAGSCGLGFAQDIGNNGYDALDAGRDAYQYHEGLRRNDFSQQLGLNSLFRYRAANPWLGYSDLESSYAYPYDGYSGRRVFEPWPFVPGDIWGFPYFRTVPQPVGQRQIQTGPNRWESHPVWPERPSLGIEDAPSRGLPREIVPRDHVPREDSKKLWERYGPA